MALPDCRRGAGRDGHGFGTARGQWVWEGAGERQDEGPSRQRGPSRGQHIGPDPGRRAGDQDVSPADKAANPPSERAAFGVMPGRSGFEVHLECGRARRGGHCSDAKAELDDELLRVVGASSVADRQHAPSIGQPTRLARQAFSTPDGGNYPKAARAITCGDRTKGPKPEGSRVAARGRAKAMNWTWTIRSPDGGMNGLEFTRATTAGGFSRALVHAAPAQADVEMTTTGW